MNKLVFGLVLLAALFYAPSGLSADTPSAGKAWIIPIKGDIEPSLVAFVRREARKAMAAKAEYIVFEIDTFGGRVDSALQITSFITSIKNARTVAWVQNSEDSMGVSWSAGGDHRHSLYGYLYGPGNFHGGRRSGDGWGRRPD